MKKFVFGLQVFASTGLFAEEVLSSRPVVIAPRRIEAKSIEVNGQPAVTRHDQQQNFELDEAKTLLMVTFRRGSIRLSKDTEKQLLALGITGGQKLRVFGFGDPNHKDAARIANLRARVIASYLREKTGNQTIQIKWTEKPHARHPGIGAILEGDK